MFTKSRLLPLLFIAPIGIATAMSLVAQEKSKDDSPASSSNIVLPAVPDKLISIDMVEAALDLPCPNLQFSGEHPLSDLLEVFEAHWAKYLPYEVPFFEDRAELDLEGLTSLEEVEITNIRISGGTHTCRDALAVIFARTTDPELAVFPVAGHIDVTTLAKAESEDYLLIRVYDLTGIRFDDVKPEADVALPAAAASASVNNETVADTQKDANSKIRKRRKKKSRTQDSEEQTSPADKASVPKVLKQFGQAGGGFGGGSPGGQQAGVMGHGCMNSRPSQMTAIITMVQEQTSPPAKWFNIDGEGGTLSTYGHYLVIQQTYGVHRQIKELLDALRTTIELNGPPKWEPVVGVAGGGQMGGGSFGGGGLGGGQQGGFGGAGGQQGGGGGGFFHLEDLAK